MTVENEYLKLMHKHGYKKLTMEEEKELIKNYKNGDKESFEKLLGCYIKYIIKQARSLERRFPEGKYDDYLQEVVMKFMKCVELYDLNCNNKFFTFFASTRPSKDTGITYPICGFKELIIDGKKKVIKNMYINNYRNVVGFDERMSEDSSSFAIHLHFPRYTQESSRVSEIDGIKSFNDKVECGYIKDKVKKMKSLSTKEKEVFYRVHFKDQSFSSVSRNIGISTQYVQIIYHRTIKKIKKELKIR